MVEEYRGYKIYNNFSSVTKRNPISGHSWSECVEKRGFTVSGKGVSCSQVFRTVETAKEHIDFVLKFPFEIPRSDRELKKAKKLGLI